MILTVNFPSKKTAVAFLDFFQFVPDERCPVGDWGRQYYVPKPGAYPEQTNSFPAYLWKKPFGPDKGTIQMVIFSSVVTQAILANKHELNNPRINVLCMVETH